MKGYRLTGNEATKDREDVTLGKRTKGMSGQGLSCVKQRATETEIIGAKMCSLRKDSIPMSVPQ